MNIDKCVICSSDQDLNTSMNVKIEEDKYSVSLCDKCADVTTPKQARESLQTKLVEIREIMEKAKELGFDLGMSKAKSKKTKGEYICDCGKICSSKGGLTHHKKSCDVHKQTVAERGVEIERPARAPARQSEPVIKTDLDENVKRAAEAAVTGNANVMSVSSQLDGVPVDSHSSFRVDDAVRKEVQAVMESDSSSDIQMPTENVTEVQEIVDASGGVATIPKVMAGNMGTTKITVKDSGGDSALQKRFKSMAKESMGSDIKSYSGTQDVNCTFCGGSGISRIGKQACPKCEGLGVITE